MYNEHCKVHCPPVVFVAVLHQGDSKKDDMDYGYLPGTELHHIGSLTQTQSLPCKLSTLRTNIVTSYHIYLYIQ